MKVQRMTKIENLEERIRNNPKGVSFNSLQQLLTYYGFDCKRKRGSHYFFSCGEERLVIVSPHGKNRSSEVATYQVKQAIEAINRIKESMD
jgi:predicted RNA binding protein YcfA (HicA-like mRNA interferase family)